MAWSNINQFTPGDDHGWSLPDDNEWLITTVEPSELLVNPEDMDLNPEDIQNDIEQWTVVAAPTD